MNRQWNSHNYDTPLCMVSVSSQVTVHLTSRKVNQFCQALAENQVVRTIIVDVDDSVRHRQIQQLTSVVEGHPTIREVVMNGWQHPSDLHRRGQEQVLTTFFNGVVRGNAIESFTLRNCLLDSAVLNLNELIQNTQLRHVELNRVSSCGHSDEEALLLFQGLASVDYLVLQNIAIGNNDCITPMADFMLKYKRLSFLDLRSCQITSIDELAPVLMHEESPLRNLCLKNNEIGDQGVISICDMLMQNASLELESLRLDWCRIGSAGAKRLGDFLAHNKSLYRLDLENNRSMGDEGVHELCRGLEENTTLTSLYMPHCSIGEKGALALARMLQVNTGLKYFSAFQYRPLWTPHAARALLDSFRHSTTWKMARIFEEQSVYQKELLFYQKLNEAGRQRFIRNDVNPALWPHILSRMQQEGGPSYVYYILQEKNAEICGKLGSRPGLLGVWDKTLHGTIRIWDSFGEKIDRTHQFYVNKWLKKHGYPIKVVVHEEDVWSIPFLVVSFFLLCCWAIVTGVTLAFVIHVAFPTLSPRLQNTFPALSDFVEARAPLSLLRVRRWVINQCNIWVNNRCNIHYN